MSTSRIFCCQESSPMLYVDVDLQTRSRRALLTSYIQEKLNEAIVVMNKSIQVRREPLPPFRPWDRNILTILEEINIENMNVELVAQMFKNYQSNVLFHLEGRHNNSWNVLDG